MGPRPAAAPRHAGDMVDVVLEADGSGDDGERPGASTERRGCPREHGDGPRRHGGDMRAGPRRTVRVVLVALTVVAVAVVNGVHMAQESRRARALATMTGVVAPLDRPLAETWELGSGAAMAYVDDLLLHVDRPDGVTHIMAVDVATGVERWRVRRGGDDGVDWCGGRIGPADDPMVLCWAGGGAGSASAPRGPAVTSRMVGLHLRDGSVGLELVTDLPRSGYGVIDGDLVMASRDRDVLSVRRVDPVTGEAVWSQRVVLRSPTTDGTFKAAVQVSDGFVVITGPTTAVLSAGDGRVLRTWHAPSTERGSVFPLAGADVRTSPHGFGAWSRREGSQRSPSGTWYDAQGFARARVEGLLAEAEVTDGSRPEVVLFRHPETGLLSAVDATTGEVLWSAVHSRSAVLLRRDGAVVLAADGEVTAVDLRTGHERWSTPVEGLRPDLAGVTDGSTVVVMAAPRGPRLLHAIDLTTGEETWTAPAPTVDMPDALGSIGGLRLTQVSGHVLYAGSGTVIGLS